MVVVTATYTYEVDTTLEEWQAQSEQSQYEYCMNVEPDTFAIQAEEVEMSSVTHEERGT